MKTLRLITGIAVLLLPVIARKNQQNQAVLSANLADQSFQDDLSSVISSSKLLSLHRALVEIESITDNELTVGKFVVSYLEDHGFLVQTQSVPPPHATNETKERWNVYATPDTSKHGSKSSKQGTPKVLLTSHIDTVPPFISYSLSSPKSKSKKFKREDILISGRGTVDAKACVAAQIQTVLELLSAPGNAFEPSDLALLFVVGEERRGDGMEHFSDSSLHEDTKGDYKAIIFGEPTEAKLATGHKGIASVNIKAHGKAAHSGYPWLGRSANSMILPALMVLDKLGDVPPALGGLPRSKRYGNSTVNVGHMEGGVAANVVSAYAEADIAIRLAGGTPEETKETVLKAIRAVDPDEALELDISQGYGPVPLDYDVDGFDSEVMNYGTDVPNLKVDEGVKKYLYGPGSILVAHGPNEGLTVGEMEQAVVDYKKLVMYALKA